MSSDQNYLEMRVLIQKHKENERIYKEKISEVNLTRARIHDQLEILKQSYDKKVKSLQQKLQNMKLQNQTLLRQNLLFKTQIDTYQNRLLEKEKIIVVLLNQKREAHLNGNSQKSKSDKTQSNQAMEQEKQHFKKHIPTFRDSPQDAQVGTSKFKDEILMTNKSNVEFKSQTSKQHNVKEKDTQENVSRVKKRIDIQQSQIPVQPVERSLLKEVKVEVQKNQFTEDNQQNSAANYFQSLAKSKQDQQLKVQLEVQTQVRKKPPPPKKKQTSKAVPQPRANKAKKHLKKRHANQQAQQQVPVEEEPLPTYQTQVQGEIYHEDAYLEQQDNHIQQNLALKTHNQEIKYQQQVQIVPEQQHYQQEKEFNYAQHFANTENIQEQQQVIETKPEQPQANNKNQQYRQFNQEEGESYNNFLSHFNSQPQQHQNMASASISPKPIARKKKTIKKVGVFGQDQAVQQDHSMNSTDFFNQLNKHEHQVPHQLDIQQSSIDHNDRDSSLISNQPHYFTQQQTVQKAKPVKMTKKKGKRDQIKVADPSLFE